MRACKVVSPNENKSYLYVWHVKKITIQPFSKRPFPAIFGDILFHSSNIQIKTAFSWTPFLSSIAVEKLLI